MESFRGLIVVPVRVGHSPPLDFVIDSGSDVSSLNDVHLAAALDLDGRFIGWTRGLGNERVPVLNVRDVVLRAGGVDLFTSDLLVHHVPALHEENLGRDLHGLLGSELFERFVVEIHPAGRSVVLHDPETFVYRGPGHVIPLIVDQRRPFVEARVTTDRGKRARIRLLVDTGMESTLMLIRSSHRKLRVPEDSREISARGVGGTTDAHIGVVEKVEIGSLTLGPSPATFMHRNSIPVVRDLPDLNGLVGNGLLGRFRTFVDYRRQRLILEVDGRFDSPVNSPALGLEVTFDWPDLSEARVTSVAEGSRAGRAGVEVGDQILAVDGQRFDLWDPRGWLEACSRRQTDCALTVQRGGSLLELSVGAR